MDFCLTHHFKVQNKSPLAVRGYNEPPLSPQPPFVPFQVQPPPQQPNPPNLHNPSSGGHALPGQPQPFTPFSQPPKRVTTHVRVPSGMFL